MRFNQYAAIIILLVLSVATNVVLGVLCIQRTAALEASGYERIDRKILSFRELFLQKIILSDQEVDFDTRLEMETAVRNLHNKEILEQWQKFTKSQTNQEVNAQAEALMELLMRKTYY